MRHLGRTVGIGIVDGGEGGVVGATHSVQIVDTEETVIVDVELDVTTTVLDPLVIVCVTGQTVVYSITISVVRTS